MGNKLRRKSDDRYESVYLTEEGMIQLKSELESLNLRFKELLSAKGAAFEGAVGDSWHDNAEYEQIQAQLEPVMARIEYLQEKIKHVEIMEINDNDLSDTTVKINDFVSVNCVFDEDDQDDIIIKLVGYSPSGQIKEYQEVSINSPLGEAIYKKNLGDTVNYNVNGLVVTATIIDKAESLEKIKCDVKKLTK